MEFNLAVMLIGLAFFVVGMIMFFKELQNKKYCTEPLIANVISYHAEETTSANDNTRSIAYYPIFRYNVGGKWYDVKSTVGRGKQKYAIGEAVDILYNPEDPANFIVKGDKLTFIISVIAIAIGIGVCILSFYAK